MRIHFIGIRGIGVSALAKYYLKKGWEVSGCDLAQSEITDQLKEMGAKTGKALPPALISEIEVESAFDDVRQLPKPNEDAAAE